MNQLPLTEKQALVLEFMRKFHADQDQLPPRHVLCRHFGWSCQNAATEYLKALERKGYIEKNVLGCKYRFTRRTEAA